jgi:ribosomal protein S18 acetylase RimI-like enzyme
MDLTLEPVLEYGLAETTELLNHGFAGYFVPIRFSLEGLLHMVVHDSVDLASSRVVLRAGEAAGVGLVARRGWSCRLAAMAIVPEARGQGVGTWLVHRLVEEAGQRGERRMVLEVIEQNTAGVRLYEGCGFRLVRRLVGYAGPGHAGPGHAGAAADLEEVDVRQVARLVTAHGLPDLPWQISGESLALVGPPSRGFRLGAAYAVISNPEAPRVGIRALVVVPAARGRGQGAALLGALMARYPDREWSMPALCPEELAGLLKSAGLERDELSQRQMALEWG